MLHATANINIAHAIAILLKTPAASSKNQAPYSR